MDCQVKVPYIPRIAFDDQYITLRSKVLSVLSGMMRAAPSTPYLQMRALRDTDTRHHIARVKQADLLQRGSSLSLSRTQQT